jgi:S1-C subfamily serine protease
MTFDERTPRTDSPSTAHDEANAPLSWARPTPAWDPGATPTATPTQPASPAAVPNWASAAAPVTAPAASPSANSAGTATPTPGQPSRRGRTAGTILGAALLSAVLASGSTIAVVELALPHGTAAAPAASPNANATAQGGTSTTTVQQEDITAVVAKAKDSVVTLTSQIATNRGPFGDATATGIGSGIILTADGYVLTNRHVVEGSQSLTATLEDGSEYPATVVTVSDTQDLALVKVQATGLKPATIGNSASIVVGQTAIAIGSPLGTYTETVTKGIISALNRTITVRDDQTGGPVTLKGLIQTDAAINAGNSGGPLLNSAGEVVGVNTATAASAEGIGFAIPIHEAQRLIEQARAASVA